MPIPDYLYSPRVILAALKEDCETVFIGRIPFTVTTGPISKNTRPLYPLWRFFPRRDNVRFKGMVRDNEAKHSVYRLVVEYQLEGVIQPDAGITAGTQYDLMLDDVEDWINHFGSQIARKLSGAVAMLGKEIEVTYGNSPYTNDLNQVVYGTEVLFTVMNNPRSTGP